MENQPEAAGAAPAPQTEATPTNSNQEPAQAPDMHGFTSEQLADMKKFFEANGGFDKIKAKISNPTPAQPQPNLDATQALRNQQEQMKAPTQPSQASEPYTPPTGAMTLQEVALENYFERLAKKEKYAGIAKEIESGEVFKEMQDLGIRAVNRDGSINPKELFGFLDLKAQTVVAKQTSTAPEAAAAPTVDYAPYDEKNMNMQQAMAILQQDSVLRSRGMGGHPNASQAEEFMKKTLNPQK